MGGGKVDLELVFGGLWTKFGFSGGSGLVKAGFGMSLRWV